MPTNVFVVWDFTIQGLKITLESLAEFPPDGCAVEVPGLRLRAGTIFDQVVKEGIPRADRVLVVTDKPNANVGFEAGLALGLGKETLFAHFGRELPAWSAQPPLRNYLQGRFTDIDDLSRLLLEEDAWLPGRAASPVPDDGPCLDLCPAQGEGAALRRGRDALGLEGWIRPPDRPFSLTELEERFGGAARLVWTVANYAEGADERDGAENAANAIIAGWFFARCRHLDHSARNERFSVLRVASSRQVVDIHLFEKEIDSLRSYRESLERTEAAWRASRAPPPEQAPPVAPLGGRADPSALRIAVLAFKDVGRPDADDGFSEGFTEWVIGDLGTVTDRYPELMLIPRQDVINVEKRDLSIAELGADLGAQYILEGSFDRTKDPCHFTARLIDVTEGTYLPFERFSQDWKLHDEASRRIAEYALEALLQRLRPESDEHLRPEDHQALDDRPKRDHVAVMAFWNGQNNRRQFNNLRQERYFRKAEAFFERALELEPAYVEALAELAFLYILKWETDSRAEWLERSRRRWKLVQDRSADDPFALAELGYLAYVQRRDAVDAVRSARLAVKVDPEHPFAHNVLALLYLYLGFWEATLVIEREEVFPRALGYIYPYANSALALQLDGRWDAALAMARRARDMESNAMVAILLEGAQHYYRDEMEEAEAVWSEGLAVCPPTVAPILEVARGWIHARRGDHGEARRLVDEHRDDAWLAGPYGPYYASLCALGGAEDTAIHLLARDVTFASSYRYLVSEPTLRPLVGQRRFRDLLERRHDAWVENVASLAEPLPERPPDLPTPSAFMATV